MTFDRYAPDMPREYCFESIGIVRSCFTGTFGIPRQPGLVPAARGRLEIFPPYARDEAFAGLMGFSHLWIVFVFHASLGTGLKLKVRPPRLGGQRKVGVFASRSPFRPNPIGISVVRNLGTERKGGRLFLHLGGIDLLDETPVLDVKPYVPYADIVGDAGSGFAEEPPGRDWHVSYSERALAGIAAADPDGSRQIGLLISQILKQDPRPGYMDRYPDRTEFGMRLYELELRWTIEATGVRVLDVAPTSNAAAQ